VIPRHYRPLGLLNFPRSSFSESPTRVTRTLEPRVESTAQRNQSKDRHLLAKQKRRAVNRAPCAYICNHCQRIFNDPSNLKRHKDFTCRPSIEKPYKCLFPDCEAAYKRGDALAVHCRAKHGQFPIEACPSDSPPAPILAGNFESGGEYTMA